MIEVPRAVRSGAESECLVLTPTIRSTVPTSISTTASIVSWESTRSTNAAPTTNPTRHASVVPARNPIPSARRRALLMTTNVAVMASGLTAATTAKSVTWNAAFTMAAAPAEVRRHDSTTTPRAPRARRRPVHRAGCGRRRLGSGRSVERPTWRDTANSDDRSRWRPSSAGRRCRLGRRVPAGTFSTAPSVAGVVYSPSSSRSRACSPASVSRMLAPASAIRPDGRHSSTAARISSIVRQGDAEPPKSSYQRRWLRMGP